MKRGCLLLLVGLVVACTRNPPSWSVVDTDAALEVLGSEAGVGMAKVRLQPSETFRFEASSCQEVLLFVESGTIRASLTWIEAGRAARFRAPTVVQAMSEGGASLFAVAVLTRAAPVDDAHWGGIDDPACTDTGEPAVLSEPSRSGPFEHAEGHLEVMIYLEGDAEGPATASLGTLNGAPDLGVPEHTHEQSAEILFIVRGSGTMRRGQETLAIAPGTFLYVPPRTLHGFVPDGTTHLFAYQVYAPSGPEQRFR